MTNLRRYYGQDFCFDKRSGNGYPKVVFAILISVFLFASIEDLIMDISSLPLMLSSFISSLQFEQNALNQRKNAFLAMN